MTTRPAGSKLAIASRMTIKLIISIVFVVVITSTSYTNFYITGIKQLKIMKPKTRQ